MPHASTTFWTASRRVWCALIVLSLLALGQSECLWHLWSRLRVAESFARSAEAARVARDQAILDRLETIYAAVAKEK